MKEIESILLLIKTNIEADIIHKSAKKPGHSLTVPTDWEIKAGSITFPGESSHHAKRRVRLKKQGRLAWKSEAGL
jgi:hypothetical protein